MKNKFLITFIVASFLGACGVSPTTKKPEAGINRFEEYRKANLGEDLKKVHTFAVDSWSSLDSQHLILWVSPFKPYLLTFEQACHDLPFAEAIQLTNKTNTIHAGLDAVVVVDRHFKTIPCHISHLQLMTKDQARDIRRLKGRDQGQKNSEAKDTKSGELD